MKQLFRLVVLFAFMHFLGIPKAIAAEPAIIKVGNGDCLSCICSQYLENTLDWPQIAKINRLADPDKIYPGQRLIIPLKYLKGITFNGTATFVKGDVRLYDHQQKSWKPLSLNDSIKQGEKILTAAGSYLEIFYPDGVILFFGEKTEVEVLKAREKRPANRLYDFFIGIGKVINKVRKATGKEIRYEIHTPTAVAAARGTDFRISISDDAATRLEVLEGIVGIGSGKKEVQIPAGHGALLAKGMTTARQTKLLPSPSLKEILPLYRSLPLKFNFNPIPESRAIRVILAKDKELQDIIKEKQIAPEESFEVIHVDDGRYYLGACFLDRYGLEGLSSEPLAFQVRVNPLPPLIKAPTNGSELKKPHCRIEWRQVPDAVKYHVQIAKDIGFTHIVVDNSNLDETNFTSKSLDYETYFFRLSAIVSDGYEGIWSGVRAFTLVPPPAAPALQPPELDDKNIRIQWQDMGKGMSYRFQLAKTSDFTQPLVDQNSKIPSITFERLENSGTYYFRVLAMDSDGYTGPFSPTQSFEMENNSYLGVALVFIVVIVGLAL